MATGKRQNRTVAVKAPMFHHTRHTGRGFTLIELLVVVAIIALLISILLPALGRARQQGKEAVCRSSLHQLALATTYYADDNQNRLPWMRGAPPEFNGYPFDQGLQYIYLFPYVKDVKNFTCPAAAGDNSTAAEAPSPTSSNYVLKFSDCKKPYKEQWWPGLDWTEGKSTGWVTKMRTEYWFNDWGGGATDPTTGEKLPAVSGGLINKLPRPSYTVIICDARYNVRDVPILRHLGASEFTFLDGHVERLPPAKYYDPKWDQAGHDPTDKDPWGNCPFYRWGISLKGGDSH
jgi:prepilin-type N-terminal cleavage/methylation domain-containing protein/prepilin-type processing-associated H-X9-DG protein